MPVAESLVVSDDLADFPGGPFADAIVDAAGAAVRTAAGWHIAPSVTETVTVKANGQVLVLPSLYVTDVDTVSDVTDPDNPVVVEDFTWAANGVVRLSGGYWAGYSWDWHQPHRTYDVTLTHGYDACPADVVAVVAQQAQNYAVDRTFKSAGPFVLADPAPLAVSHRLPSRP